jgi:hypothetical protein
VIALEDFPNRRTHRRFEGGTVYVAERDEKCWVLVDEGTMADLLSEEDLGSPDDYLPKFLVFDSDAERLTYLRSRGWA